MPTVMITRTIGRNLVEGQLRKLSSRVIRQISETEGDDWYMQELTGATRRYMQDAPKSTRKKGKAA